MKRIKGVYSLSVQEVILNTQQNQPSSKHTKLGLKALKKLIEKLKK
jgi:hypothetical protein